MILVHLCKHINNVTGHCIYIKQRLCIYVCNWLTTITGPFFTTCEYYTHLFSKENVPPPTMTEVTYTLIILHSITVLERVLIKTSINICVKGTERSFWAIFFLIHWPSPTEAEWAKKRINTFTILMFTHTFWMSNLLAHKASLTPLSNLS